MNSTDAVRTLHRFQLMMEELEIDRSPVAERAWMQLSVIAALPWLGVQADAIERLRAHAEAIVDPENGIGLRSGLRYCIAGVLLHAGMAVSDFARDQRRLREMLAASGATVSADVAAATIAIMILRSPKRRLGVQDLALVVDLFHHLRRHHWWQREVADAPLAAMVGASEDGCSAQGMRLEDMRQQLGDVTGASSPALTATAGILVAHASNDVSVARFADLFRASGSDPRPGLLPGLALWTWLDAEPMAIMDAADMVTSATGAQASCEGAAAADLICGSLTYLTLSPAACAAAERATHPLRDPLRRFHAACVLAGLELFPH